MALIDPTQEPAATTKATPKKHLKSSVFLVVTSTYPVVEPFTQQRFEVGVPTETPEITQWLQYQIDAGLMEVTE
jgi:hypothetical protein